MEDIETEAAPAAFQLTLKGPGITVERELDQGSALQVLAIAMGASLGGAAVAQSAAPTASAAGPASTPPPASAVAASVAGAHTPGSNPVSVREYLSSVEPKRNVDKILAIASYLKVHRGQETFTPDAVKREFRHAGEPVPGNYPRDFRWAVSAGWIASSPEEPGEYYVTNTGHDAVAKKFDQETKKTSSVPKSARQRRARKKVGES